MIYLSDKRSPNLITTLCLAAFLVLLAGSLRFYKLGSWSFGPDEVATLQEAASLFQETSLPRESDYYRLPRIIPLGYPIMHSGYTVFGRDEFGSRVVPALFGTASVLVVFLGLLRPLGTPTALATALLVAVWPAHLLVSQFNRFYMIAFFFASLSVILGIHAWVRRSVIWVALASLAAMLAGLSHTFLFLLLGGLFAAILCAAVAERSPIPWRMLTVVVAAGVVIGVFTTVYLLPLSRGWNSGETWGYSVPKAIQASVSSIGWPFVLLAPLGLVSLRCAERICSLIGECSLRCGLRLCWWRPGW